MPKGRRKLRMNRAVGVFNKGDEFEAGEGDPRIDSLVGAGYADVVYDPGGDEEVPDGDPVHRGSGEHSDSSVADGHGPREGDGEPDSEGGPEAGGVRQVPVSAAWPPPEENDQL